MLFLYLLYPLLSALTALNNASLSLESMQFNVLAKKGVFLFVADARSAFLRVGVDLYLRTRRATAVKLFFEAVKGEGEVIVIMANYNDQRQGNFAASANSSLQRLQ